jgi:DNA-binding beta-propeller fold protein YncE
MRSNYIPFSAYLLCLCLLPSSAVGQTGALTQLPGVDGCVSETGSGGCADGVALDAAFGVAVSPDGRNVYIASLDGAVAVFARDRRTGALTQLPGTDACVSEDGTGGSCTDGVALFGASKLAVSPDGRNIYVASEGSDAVAVFARDRKTGALTQLPGTDACVSEDGTDGACADGIALDALGDVAVSPDGRNVYVVSLASDAVAVFARNRKTGALTQLPGTDACVSEDGTGGACAIGVALNGASGGEVSPDGRNVYVASSFDSSAVAVFARDRRTGALTQLAGTDACVSDDGTGGSCADGVALTFPTRVAVSPDSRNVYVASVDIVSFSAPGEVAVFARDRKTGALTQLPGTDACISMDGDGCADAVALRDPSGIAVSPDGRNIYIASRVSKAVAALARDRKTGALTQLPGTDACISEFDIDGACADGVALNQPEDVAVSRDRRNVYVVSLQSDAVAVFARERKRHSLAAR